MLILLPPTLYKLVQSQFTISVYHTLIARCVFYLYTVLQVPAEVDVGHLDHLQLIGLLHVLDPLVGLPLGVDHQGPAVSTHHNDGILH